MAHPGGGTPTVGVDLRHFLGVILRGKMAQKHVESTKMRRRKSSLHHSPPTHQQLQFIRMPSVYRGARWARNRVLPCTGWLLLPTALALISFRVKIINDYDDHWKSWNCREVLGVSKAGWPFRFETTLVHFGSCSILPTCWPSNRTTQSKSTKCTGLINRSGTIFAYFWR